MLYLLFFHCNIGWANGPKWHVIRKAYVLLITVMCNWFRITSYVKFHSLHSFTSFQLQFVLYLFIRIVHIPLQILMNLFYFQINYFSNNLIFWNITPRLQLNSYRLPVKYFQILMNLLYFQINYFTKNLIFWHITPRLQLNSYWLPVKYLSSRQSVTSHTDWMISSTADRASNLAVFLDYFIEFWLIHFPGA
jgi:hypothetical protein